MFCTQCGSQLGERDRFCSQCAHPTTAACLPRPTAGHRLVRDVQNKKIAGVCAGFAEYLDVDVTLVRILWAALTLTAGIGLIAYIVGWIVMPKGPAAAVSAEYARQSM
jgi:phage shock protein C